MFAPSINMSKADNIYMKKLIFTDICIKMARRTSRPKDLPLILVVVLVITSQVEAAKEYTHCDKAFVPCPRVPGFQFFNKTCYGIIRDPLPFGAGDSYFKCESGMHLTFTDPSMAPHEGHRRTAMDRRMTLARVTSFGALNVLTKLRRQVVPEPSESTLVDLACSEECTSPASWRYTGSAAFPAHDLNCADSPACDWQRDGHSVWARPPGSHLAFEAAPGQPVMMAALNTTTATDTDTSAVPLRNRLAVLGGAGALSDVSETISLHSLACEIPFTTTDEGIQQLLPMNLAMDADMSLHSQMVNHLEVESVNGSRTHVRLRWGPPICEVPAFYVTVMSDLDGSTQERRQVEAGDVCDEALEHCQTELELPLCSLLYIQVGAVLKGQDAAPDVVQWQTPAQEDPPTPESFFISEISGSVVTLSWRDVPGLGPCQPYHEVTIEGHGEVTLKPGVTEFKADLDNHCWHFNASVKATILGRNSSVRGPIHGVTGPKAPDAVYVLATGSTWSTLEWSPATGRSSPCVKANYRVTCEPLPSSGSSSPWPSVSMTSPDLSLNVTGLLPGVQYRCGVCALASLMDTAPSDTALKRPPCGDARTMELATDETAPGMPHGLNIAATSHETLTLEWRRPQEPNGVIVRYNISVTCEPVTFPLCTSDPLCVDRWFTVPLEGNDTDHVTFTVTGLQAARLHHVTVAAATAAGQGPFSSPFSADTRVGVPPPSSQVTVTSRVKDVVGHGEQTSVSVSLQPPCPFPGLHDYRMRFERVDFLAGYQSTVRAAVLSPDEIGELYSGVRNITFSVFDGKWTPGFNYVVRIVAHTDNKDLGKRAYSPSAPVNFTMTVPPPGEVRRLKADCSSRPLRLSFSWSNPTKFSFGIVSYRSRYQCRHPITGHEVVSEDWDSCHHSQCPCVSSQPRSNQCTACERVCSYPVKQFNFKGARTYYFNCTCERRVADAPVMPGSECQVTVQAESKYHQQRGALSSASCQMPEYTAQVTDLKVKCDSRNLSASWAVPKPLEVTTEVYHVNIQRSGRATGQQEMFVDETVGESQCEKTHCRTTWSGLDGDVTYTVQVAAESVYSSPAVGPAAESSCLSPARVPLPPSEDVQNKVEELSGWREDLDPSRQYLLRLPGDLYDIASGTLRELRIAVSKPGADSNTTSLQTPSSGSKAELPELATWQQFSTNQKGAYQASPPAFVPDSDGTDPAEFVLGGDTSCSSETSNSGEESHCNGPLEPSTTYAAQLMFVNDAGFASSRPFTFRTKSVREAKQEKAARARAENGRKASDGSGQRAKTNGGESGSGWGTMGRSGLAGDVPELDAASSGIARSGKGVTPASVASLGNSTTPEPEEAGISVGAAVGASVGALAAAGSLLGGLFLWKRRSGGGG